MIMVLFGTVRANGSVLWPLGILFISFFPIRLGFIAAMHPVIGSEAIWIGFPLGTGAALLMAVAYYRFGRWRENQLVHAMEWEAEESAHATLEPAGAIRPGS
jgi:Na+-driven multidrug efflux pump